jgi:aminoglycoside phosphotransferase (APT) family kinase protein
MAGRAVALMHRVHGVTWEQVAADHSHRYVAEQAVQALHGLRELPVEATGIADDPVLTNEAEVERWAALASRCPHWLQPGVEELKAKLLGDVPQQAGVSLVHGDFHYSNLLFADGKPVAIFDWEIATLGDPLTDFGCLAVASLRRRYHPEPNPTGDVEITLADLADLYGVGPELASWHVAASAFKYSVIIGYNLQLHLRGKKLDPIYTQLTGTARRLLVDGAEILAHGLGKY